MNLPRDDRSQYNDAGLLLIFFNAPLCNSEAYPRFRRNLESFKRSEAAWKSRLPGTQARPFPVLQIVAGNSAQPSTFSSRSTVLLASSLGCPTYANLRRAIEDRQRMGAREADFRSPLFENLLKRSHFPLFHFDGPLTHVLGE